MMMMMVMMISTDAIDSFITSLKLSDSDKILMGEETLLHKNCRCERQCIVPKKKEATYVAILS